MAFKIPFLDAQSFRKGYFCNIPNFRWADVTEKEEIGKGIIELAQVNSQINCSKIRCSTVRVVKTEVDKLQTQNTLISLLTVLCKSNANDRRNIARIIEQ